ncbi:hypothetical protein LX32DRAFT_192679 [Colletotrichum zoysiae]|uniref:Uncharacterized protein n=1 Tax=Colletotrichum zoysiae TaxID=1216348 RepID=A0AAD9LVU3_9PEZI|nr:hypothetical protein LX32DRAFT_192679 [Colletotrichum zoysiae]
MGIFAGLRTKAFPLLFYFSKPLIPEPTFIKFPSALGAMGMRRKCRSLVLVLGVVGQDAHPRGLLLRVAWGRLVGLDALHLEVAHERLCRAGDAGLALELGVGDGGLLLEDAQEVLDVPVGQYAGAARARAVATGLLEAVAGDDTLDGGDGDLLLEGDLLEGHAELREHGDPGAFLRGVLRLAGFGLQGGAARHAGQGRSGQGRAGLGWAECGK